MTQTPPPPPYAYQPVQPLNPSDQRLWATLVHVGGLFLHIWPSLIGYLVLKDRGDFVRDHTRTALNFQLTLLIAYLAGAILSLVFIGILIIIAAAVVDVVFSILAAIAAHSGQPYKYPLTIEFVK